MANQKMNKKATSTMIGIVIVMLVVIGIFVGYYSFLSDQFTQFDATVDDKYSTTYDTLLEEQEFLDNQTSEIREAVNNVREAESGILAAINGFKGLGKTLLLFIGISDSGFTVFEAVFFSPDVVPPMYQSLLIIGILALIIFVVIAILKGEPKVV